MNTVLSPSIRITGDRPAPTFGIRSNPDPDARDLFQVADEVLLESNRPEPNPKRWFQGVFSRLNRFVLLPFIRRVSVETNAKELDLLRDLPKNAGNLMVGTHPDLDDPLVMLHVLHKSGKRPDAFSMASEVRSATPRYLRKFWDYLGGLPVVRGRGNAETIRYLTDKIAQGGWSMIFPEGGVFYTRQIQPMEAGGVRIALDAAIAAQQQAEKNGEKVRPIYMTPTAHVYQHTRPKEMARKMEKQLAVLESQPGCFSAVQQGTIPERIARAERQILARKEARYGIVVEGWEKLSTFEQSKQLRTRLLEGLEQQYLGQAKSGPEKRRVLKIRMGLYEEALKTKPSPARVLVIKEDIRRTLDVMRLISVDEGYAQRHEGPEYWAETLRRLSDMLCLSTHSYGKRQAKVKVMPPVDMHPIAKKYRALVSMKDRQEMVFQFTEALRSQIQAGVDQLSSG